MMNNLGEILESTRKSFPQRTAVIASERRFSYQAIDDAANQAAHLLVELGTRPGDRVALSCPNVVEFSIFYFAILKAGATVVPLNILFTEREITYHLNDSQARVFIAVEGSATRDLLDRARAGFEGSTDCSQLLTVDSVNDSFMACAADRPTSFDTQSVSPDDTAVILYTSGTTGQPKGAELRHRNMVDNARIGCEVFGVDPEHPDTYMSVLPLFHSFGQTVVLNGAFVSGGTIVLVERFEPTAVLESMYTESVTFFAGVPTMYWGLLGAVDSGVDVRSVGQNLRVACSGGASLPLEVHRSFAEAFDVTILEGYGLSETSPIAAFNHFGQPPTVGSVGHPIRGVEFSLIEDDWTEIAGDLLDDGKTRIGEVAIRGHNIMKGYFGRPDATAEAIRDGWFRTGDLGQRDGDGLYYIVDRSKDMIIRGGYNVYPREIEEVLLTHPAVSLVAVVGVEHATHGEEIKAVIVPVSGAEISDEELIVWSKTQLASYKYPRIVEFREALPLTSTGKILKREI